MALRFALLRDYQRGDPSSFRSRTQFEVFFIDLDTEEELVRYLRRPEVSQFSQGVLVPLCDTVMLVCDRFRFSPPIARDSPWIRHQTSIYLRYLVREPTRGAIRDLSSANPSFRDTFVRP